MSKSPRFDGVVWFIKEGIAPSRCVGCGKVGTWLVSAVKESEQKRSPRAPFTTSTLQQTASSRLGYSPSRTMQIAQKLYEAGHITYMRTDSTNLGVAAQTQIITFAKKKYGDERKTKVISGAAKIISAEDLVAEEETILILTQGGYVKRIKPDEYRVQKRGGKGVIGVTTKDEDFAYEFIGGNTHDDLLFFTNLGKVYQTKMYEIPEGTRQAKGKAIANFLSLAVDEKVTSVLPVPKTKKGQSSYVILSTQKGVTKKVNSKDFEDVRHSGIRAINLQKGDTLRFARVVMSGEEIVLSSKLGQAIRFKEKDIRAMGRTAQGIRGMRLKSKDELVGMDILPQSAKKLEILSVSQLGYGKKTLISQYRLQKRGGSGVKTCKVTSKTGNLVSVQVVKDDQEEIIAISKKGQVIRAPLSQIPSLSRATQGVRIMKLNSGDSVASVTLL